MTEDFPSLTIQEIYKDVSDFKKRNSCFQSDPFVRLAFTTEELGEVSRELLKGSISELNSKALATEVFDVFWNLCGILKSQEITPEDFAEAARAKMTKNKKRKFPTH